MTDPRVVDVAPERLPGWLERFAGRHGDPVWRVADGRAQLRAPDGAGVVLASWPASGQPSQDADPGVDPRPDVESQPGPGQGRVPGDYSGGAAQAGLGDSPDAGSVPDAVPAELPGWLFPPERLGLILVRRGGYAVGLAEDAVLTRHRCGTRYVQSRTAAGGWSQQRFARRRGNQAAALVGTVTERAEEVVLGVGARPGGLVVGGDRALIRDVLAAPGLAVLAELPRRELYDLPDPRLAVLQRALARGRAIRLWIVDPGEGGEPDED